MSWAVRNPSDPHPELIHIWFGDSMHFSCRRKCLQPGSILVPVDPEASAFVFHPSLCTNTKENGVLLIRTGFRNSMCCYLRAKSGEVAPELQSYLHELDFHF